jgi:hypothetical protein
VRGLLSELAVILTAANVRSLRPSSSGITGSPPPGIIIIWAVPTSNACSTFVAPRGHRHGFRNPSGEAAQVLGLWAPPGPALAFMRDTGAALSPDTPLDPDRMRKIYARHASRLLP